ncbi:MAG: CHAT domain-containing protein, partial [Hydrococcus sp. Prado102]|nr:CHAT domain-containing protein [Hydrococcus sp. Prado102]
VILNDKTYLILQRPDGQLHRYQININSDELTQRVRQWRDSLEDVFNHQYLIESQALYEILIRPLEAELQASDPQFLIFIPDGILRNIPLAALHDGKQFLVEKYPIAVSLGFNLTFAKPAERKLSSLTFGLTKAKPPFQQELPDVAKETQAVQAILGGNQFMNEEFSWKNFREQLLNNESPIVHLATHGIFTGTVERSFLQTFNRPITLTDLESLLNKSQQTIELLTLSACQTAAGNDRSVLGMSGVALRSGVKSLLGSLWFSNDAASTELIADFYRHLKQGATKAEALQKAQKAQISNQISHPGIWSNLVLVGNWL